MPSDLVASLIPVNENDDNSSSIKARAFVATANIMASATAENFFYIFRTLFLKCLEIEDEASFEQVENNLGQDVFFDQLHSLGWLKLPPEAGLLSRTVEEALHETLRQKIVQEMDSIEDYGEAGLVYGAVQTWIEGVLMPWVRKFIIRSNGDTSATEKEALQKEWTVRLEKTCADCYCRLRMANMFDIVADYPDSLPAVEELRLVLQRTGLQANLAKSLQESLQRRLCHPGANTGQIIDMYISTIKVLRVIDPSDRLLTTVAEPIRQYLRGRADTVRSIIGSLTGSTPSDLYQELRRQDAKPLEDVTVDSEDEEECPTMDWYPQPSIHQPQGSFLEGSRTTGGGGSSNSDGDILAMLVSIYGSKELFVNEYRLMLADKLLANLDYNVDQEVHTLELLKLRFGEMSMRSCEVMLKDLNDSKRTNTNISSFLDGQANTVVDAVMVSHIFWPQLHDEPMKHHPKMQYMLDVFGKEYARLKNPRVLLWFHQLGTVDLEAEVVEPNGQTFVKEFNCSPLLATLLSHFEDKPEWTAVDLSNETGIPEHLIQKRMSFWINQRVIRLVTTAGTSTEPPHPVYVLASVDHLSSTNADDHHSVYHHHDTSEGGGVSFSAQEEEEMEVYLSYIVGMLMLTSSLPLKTIHNNLKTFVTGSDIRYNKTPQQLAAFLQRLCKEERLECGPDGLFKLFKK